MEDAQIEEEKKESKLKNFIIWLLTFFLLVLFITYLTTNSIIFSILNGFIESSKINKETLSFDLKNGKKVMLSQDSYKELMNLYDVNVEKEFQLCMLGYLDKGIYLINKTLVPKTYFQSVDKVIFDRCSNATLISLHSHPKNRCIPSDQDLSNFAELKRINKDTLLAVICSRDRLNFYG